MGSLSKKAQVQSMAPAVIALVFAAIVLVLGLVIVQEVRNTDVVTTDEGASGTRVNESVSMTSGLTRNLAASLYPNGACGNITAVYNVSAGGNAGAQVNAANWTQTGCALVNDTDIYSVSSWLVTYTYTRSGEVYNSANESLSGLATFTDFWEIIVLAIVISIVIGLLLVAFGRSGRR